MMLGCKASVPSYHTMLPYDRRKVKDKVGGSSPQHKISTDETHLRRRERNHTPEMTTLNQENGQKTDTIIKEIMETKLSQPNNEADFHKETMSPRIRGRAQWLTSVIPALWEAKTITGLDEVAHACNPSTFGRTRKVDHLRSGVQDQPGQHAETPSLLKNIKIIQAW
ncbi:Zinc finger protein 714 [Plecturocebus cupreus]